MKCSNKFLVNFVANKHDQAGARLLACTIEILKNKIIPTRIIAFKNINKGFFAMDGKPN